MVNTIVNLEIQIFHTDKYKIRTILKTITNTNNYSFFDLNSFCINALRGGEIK